MSRFVLVLCLSICLAAISASAQQMKSASGAEIGTLFGLSRISTGGEVATLIGLPSALGSSSLGNPSIYVSWFMDERFSIGPEFSLGRLSGEGVSVTSLYLAGRTAFHPGGAATTGAYVFGRGALRYERLESSGQSLSDTDVSLGAGLGYRWRAGSGLVVRAEGGYRRWFDDPGVNGFSLLPGVNDFSLLLGLGARTGGAAAVQDNRSSQPEIGTFFGLSRISTDGEEGTLIALPSALLSGVVPNPSIYLSWSMNERFSIGPEFSLGRTSGDGDTITSLYLAGRTAFHSGGAATSGAYVFGRGAVLVVSGDDSESETEISLGAGLGYRWRVGSGLVVRAESAFRQWFDDPGTYDISLLIGLGASVGD